MILGYSNNKGYDREQRLHEGAGGGEGNDQAQGCLDDGDDNDG